MDKPAGEHPEECGVLTYSATTGCLILLMFSAGVLQDKLTELRRDLGGQIQNLSPELTFLNPWWLGQKKTNKKTKQ